MKRGTLVVILATFVALSWGNSPSAAIEQGRRFHAQLMLSPFLFGCPAAGGRVQTLNQDSEDRGEVTPGWKRGMALGSETVGAAAAALGCAFVSAASAMGSFTYKRGVLAASPPYVVTSGLITSTVAWAVGRLWGQRFSWPGSSVGAAAGAALACGLLLVGPDSYSSMVPFLAATLVPPTTGAILGGNLLSW